MQTIIITAIVSLLIGVFVGWVIAHNVIATEVEKIGKFYVGASVYSCTKLGTPHYEHDNTIIGMKDKP